MLRGLVAFADGGGSLVLRGSRREKKGCGQVLDIEQRFVCRRRVRLGRWQSILFTVICCNRTGKKKTYLKVIKNIIAPESTVFFRFYFFPVVAVGL